MVTLANEITMSIENINQFYVGVILCISTIENIAIEKLSFVINNIFLLKITPYMLQAICRPTLFRFNIKVYRPPFLKRVQQKKQVCKNAADPHFSFRKM
jgi:hypothetical protein